MLNRKFFILTFIGIIGFGLNSPVQASDEIEQLKKMILDQQHQLDQLKKKLQHQEQKIEATAEVVDNQQESSTSQSNTQLGGYGELHYNHSNKGDDQLDFHRFVLFASHKFNERLRFFSELEVEHSVSSSEDEGEVELEQAYLEYDLNEGNRIKIGSFLLPVGILNETHEPNTFYGVERNPVEKNIIPSTWWEGGVMLSGEIAKGLKYDFALTSGFNTDASENYQVRSGRQQAMKAVANDFAYTGRISWVVLPGVKLATTIQYQQDMTQGKDPNAGSALLIETHAEVSRGNFGLRALYAHWDLNGAGPKSVGADQQKGWYIEPSYKLNEQWGVFARYNEWDNTASNNLFDSNKKQTSVGFNYWLDPKVVLKADYESFSGALDGNGFNLGMGYQF